MHKNIIYGILTGVVTAVLISLLSSSSIAQMMDGTMGGMSGSMGHNMGNMGASYGSGTLGGMMTHSSYPGAVVQTCHPQGSMPPHYCEPVYNVMSSVRGITISAVDAVSDKEVVLTVKQIGSSAGSVSQKLVLVGGSGNLAGATIIDGGWERSKVVELKFDGLGTIYDYDGMHLHLFPYTGQ